MPSEYLTILILFLLVALFLEKWFHLHLYPSRRKRLIFIATIFTIGIIWDSFAIWRGHWIFPHGRNIGVRIGLMPLEEYLFLLIIPYFIITFYKLLTAKIRNRK